MRIQVAANCYLWRGSCRDGSYDDCSNMLQKISRGFFSPDFDNEVLGWGWGGWESGKTSLSRDRTPPLAKFQLAYDVRNGDHPAFHNLLKSKCSAAAPTWMES